MNLARVGPVVTLLTVAGVGLIFYLNRETDGPLNAESRRASSVTVTAAAASAEASKAPADFREYPIGDEVVRNDVQVAAVWLPSVGMAGMESPSDDVIHVEADVRATANNPNGFAKDEFVPYLKIHYELKNAASGRDLASGDLTPMVAADGLHYGANIARPGPGLYKLIYKIEPPSAGGLGRHSDPATGVKPWWEPFEVAFDWTMPATTGPAVARSSTK